MDILGESNPLTALVVDLEDVDPDDAFSVVPYEKGAAFLWYLEELVGGPGKKTRWIFKNIILVLDISIDFCLTFHS